MIYLPSEFPQDTGLYYLNHAAIGPWPRRTAQVIARFAQQNMTRGGADYPQWLKVENRLRERLARLINAGDPADIALVQNTSEGLSIISQGIDWHDGDEVIGFSGDFCSNQMVWQVLADRGVSYKVVDAWHATDPEQALIDAFSPRTRLLAVSSVHFATGYRLDLARLSEACIRNGILLSVDAIQSLGARRFDLDEVPADFVVAGGHKWLLSAEGLGFMYCRPGLRDRLKLHRFGWAMREAPYGFESEDWSVAVSARRFEAGTPNMMGIHAMDATLSLFEELGVEFVEQRLAENVAFLEDAIADIPGTRQVTPAEPSKRAGILTFTHAQADGAQLHAALMASHVICSPRAGGIRLSPHFYTPQSVLEEVIGIIRRNIQIIMNNE